jgi:hypothetical protein
MALSYSAYLRHDAPGKGPSRVIGWLIIGVCAVAFIEVRSFRVSDGLSYATAHRKFEIRS